MKFYEKHPITQCLKHGHNIMFKYCYHYLPGGYYHDFKETSTFREQYMEHPVSLPLSDKNTQIQTRSDKLFKGLTIMVKTVQIHSQNHVHIYKDGFANEPTSCNKQHYCYNYSSHHARLIHNRPNHYYAFYFQKIRHMSLFTSSKLYNSEYLFQRQLYTDLLLMRYSERFWTLDPESQRTFAKSASRTQLKRGKWKGSWVEASRLCKSVGGSLPILISKAEQDELMALLKFSYGIQPPHPLIYIGLVQHKVRKKHIKVYLSAGKGNYFFVTLCLLGCRLVHYVSLFI